MAQTVYDLGDIARLAVTFTVEVADVDTPTDPTDVSAVVTAPDGTSTTYQYNPGDIVREDVGVYHLDVQVTQAGEWTYKFTGTGSAADIGAGSFFVNRDETTQDASLYVTESSLKNTLSLTGQTFADSDISQSIRAASRAVDRATGRRYFTVVETRYYTPDPRDLILDINDLETTGSTAVFAVDIGGTGSFSTWTKDTDFTLEPINAAVDDQPYTQMVLKVGRTWPSYRNTVRISNGSFGWPSVPADIIEATTLVTNRLLKRKREAQLGVITAGIETGVALHIARKDPDVVGLLMPFDRRRPLA